MVQQPAAGYSPARRYLRIHQRLRRHKSGWLVERRNRWDVFRYARHLQGRDCRNHGKKLGWGFSLRWSSPFDLRPPYSFSYQHWWLKFSHDATLWEVQAPVRISAWLHQKFEAKRTVKLRWGAARWIRIVKTVKWQFVVAQCDGERAGNWEDVRRQFGGGVEIISGGVKRNDW